MKGTEHAFVMTMPDHQDAAGNVTVEFNELHQLRMARYQTANQAILSFYGHKIVRMSHQVMFTVHKIFTSIYLILRLMFTGSICLMKKGVFSLKAQMKKQQNRKRHGWMKEGRKNIRC
jgi:hypothetical protein